MEKERKSLRVALPLANGMLSSHFGESETFAFIEICPLAKDILTREDLPAPPHEPGVLPRWLAEQKVDLVIAGRMGQRAQQLLSQQGIQLLSGIEPDSVENLLARYLAGTLQPGSHRCDH